MTYIYGEQMVWQDAFLSDDIIEMVNASLKAQGIEIDPAVVLEVMNACAPAMAAVTMSLAESAMVAIFCNGDISSHHSGECECLVVDEDGEDEPEPLV